MEERSESVRHRGRKRGGEEKEWKERSENRRHGGGGKRRERGEKEGERWRKERVHTYH